MSLFQLSILTALITNVSIGIAVFFTNRKRVANQHFFTMTLITAAWLASLGFSSMSDNSADLEFWIRQSSLLGALTPATFNILRFAISRPTEGWLIALWHGRVWLLCSAGVGILCQSDLFLTGANISYPVGEPIYGHGFLLYVGYFITAISFMIYGFVRDTKNSIGIHRIELQFTLLGCATGLLFGISVSLLIPLFSGNIISGQILPFSGVILYGTIAYGIATRRIMNVGDILRRATSYSLVTLYLLTLYFVVWWLVDHACLALLLRSSSMLPHVVASLTLAFSMAPANGIMQRFSNRLFVNAQPIDMRATMRQANDVLQSITRLDELLSRFSEYIGGVVGTDRIIVLLAEDGVVRQEFFNRHYC